MLLHFVLTIATTTIPRITTVRNVSLSIINSFYFISFSVFIFQKTLRIIIFKKREIETRTTTIRRQNSFIHIELKENKSK
jgi:hypothetical protein